MRVMARRSNKPKLPCLFVSPNFTHQASNSAKHTLSALTVEQCCQFQISLRDSLYNAIRISSPQQLGKALHHNWYQSATVFMIKSISVLNKTKNINSLTAKKKKRRFFPKTFIWGAELSGYRRVQSVLLRSRVQKFPAWHTKAAPNGKCCEGYIVPSMVRLMCQLKSVLK